MKKIISLLTLILLPASIFSQVTFVNAFPNLTFSAAVYLTHSGDATNRIFVVQQGGLIRVFPNDSTTSAISTFLNVTDKISVASERGLLGLAFHPNYSSNRYFFIYYTRIGDGAMIVSRFTTQAGNPNKADSLSELNMLTVLHPTYANHNGGCLMFGQDGFLYIGMGDGGSGGDPFNNAQNVNVLSGKINRINVNNPSGGNNYGIPPTNPFAGGGGRPEIFCWGMRNPWRFTQDPVTGLIYCGDVGQDAWEEVDIITVGLNYGWRCYEGNAPYNLSGCGPITNYTFPIHVYQNVASDCSITGGYVYRGARVNWLVGRYVFADYCSRKTWKFLYSGGNVTEHEQIGTAPGGVTSFGVDQNNELYVVTFPAAIYKLQNSVIGVNGNGTEVPEGYLLEQNYPNPFNPKTIIKFSIPVGDAYMRPVQMKIFDVNGKEVSVIVNENKTAGNYSVEWDGTDYPSGIYFYRLTAGDVSIEKKMVLIK